MGGSGVAVTLLLQRQQRFHELKGAWGYAGFQRVLSSGGLWGRWASLAICRHGSNFSLACLKSTAINTYE
jgi:hypothetical protein